MRLTRRILFVLCAIALLSCSTGGPASTAKQPNIVFILTDDTVTTDIPYMPKTVKLIGDQGTTFSQFFISMPLCCPSRTSILRGQYAHNTQIWDNQPPGGGFEKFYGMNLGQSTMATWLQKAGYRTVLIGKYLNGYAAEASPTYIPPGWTEWYSSPGDPHFNDATYTEYNYTLNENGTLVRYHDRPEDYGTDVYARKAVDFIKRNAATGKPFFAYISTYAPHKPATPAPRHVGMFDNLPLPRPPSFNEADISDKSRFFSDNPLLTDQQISELTKLYHLRLESLQAVDDMVENIVTTLRDTGQLDNTYIFFTSDNGFHLGEHRLLEGKKTAFEEDIRVPLLVRGPGIPTGKVINQLTGNVDLAPTFAELAGAQTPKFVDGRSLVPLLKGRFVFWWRNAFLLEFGSAVNNDAFSFKIPAVEDGPQVGDWEPPDSIYDSKAGGSYTGLRTGDYTYVEFLNGDTELYDLHNDPYELRNIAGTADPHLLARLHKWLKELKTCVGDSCRSYDIRP